METYVGGDKKVVVKSAAEVLDYLKSRVGEAITASEVRDYKYGTAERLVQNVFLTIERDKFLDIVDAMGELDFPHFHVLSGNDDGDTISQNYHFSLFRREGRGNEVSVCVTVNVPKSDLLMPSLHSRVPGVGFAEREMLEMLGVDHDGQPVKDLVFLPDGWDRSILPWRRDETGPEGKGVINELN